MVFLITPHGFRLSPIRWGQGSPGDTLNLKTAWTGERNLAPFDL